MKKLLFVLAIGAFGALASCNNNSPAEATKDSTTNAIDSTASAQKDSVNAQADTTKKMIDSTKKEMKDSVKGKM
ncbi:MAG: hypothetical protein ACR2FN_02695 [Chitinophagaceae bacterium]